MKVPFQKGCYSKT